MSFATGHCGTTFVTTPLGHRLHLDSNDARAQEVICADGLFNDGSLRVWEAALAMRTWDIVIDVGANYGEMILGATMPSGARVVAYEPNPRIVPYLRRSVEESGLDVEVREVAIGARDTMAAFVRDIVWSGRSGLATTHRTDADHALETIDVTVRRLDSELVGDSTSSICIKVDVEGGEFDVLDGATHLLGHGRPWAVMVEILHMDAFEVAQLARTYRMAVMDRLTHQLVRVPPTTAEHVDSLLSSRWIHGQDAILTSRDGG